MLLIPLVSAPTVVVIASAAERRWGAGVAGWMAAIPTTLPIGILAVAVELGDRAGAAMALSAAAHVGAQVAFAVSFAWVMTRFGALAGLLAGAATFAALSLVVHGVPASVAAAAAIPALLVGPRLFADHRATDARPRPRRRRDVTVACAATVALVGAVLFTASLAGPAAAGAIGAFPALSAVLVILTSRGTGTQAAARTLHGVIRGLPGYLIFCLVVTAAAGRFGTPVAVLFGLTACLVTCGLTWRSARGRGTPPAPYH